MTLTPERWRRIEKIAADAFELEAEMPGRPLRSWDSDVASPAEIPESAAKEKTMRRPQANRYRRSYRKALGAVPTFLIALLLLAGCNGDNGPTSPGDVIVGSGRLATESRPVQAFFGVSVVDIVADVVIQHGAAEALQVTADDNLLQYITTEVSGGLLVLGDDPNVRLSSNQAFLFEVTIRELSELRISGVADVAATGIDTNQFTVDLSGVGTITPAGSVDRQDVTIQGTGTYQAEGLASRIARVNLTGAGTAVVRVSERLEGHVDAACTLEYFGDPEVAVTGGGTVRRVGS